MLEDGSAFSRENFGDKFGIVFDLDNFVETYLFTVVDDRFHLFDLLSLLEIKLLVEFMLCNKA